VHAFTAGVYVSVASACLLVAIAVAGWCSERRRAVVHHADQRRSAAPCAEIAGDPLDIAA
jgi:hypothetical protein